MGLYGRLSLLTVYILLVLLERKDDGDPGVAISIPHNPHPPLTLCPSDSFFFCSKDGKFGIMAMNQGYQASFFSFHFKLNWIQQIIRALQ